MIARDAEPADLPAELAATAKKLRGQFAALAPQRRWLKAQPDGPELDVDACVRNHADRAAGHPPDRGGFLAQARCERDLACLLLAERLAGAAQPAYPLDRVVSGLLLAGFALKLALAPVYFWLPAVAESAAPVSVVLIISVVDIAAFRELVHFRTAMPWVFDQHQAVWLAVALLSMFLGALLALGQKNLRRMLAFSTIDDMGYLLLGVVAGTEAGLTGALLGALAHALFKLLLFGAVGVAENGLGRPLTLADRGLGCRYPRSAAAFIAGALGMIGVPPMIGFAGRWRIYLAGVELGGVWLGLAMALATVLALFYYVRAMHRVWLGPSEAPAGERREPKLAGGLLVALIAAVIVLGLIPAWLLAI
jgi:formate hydrogenlyase subunit 3/multisubunit Na+/H+ antiporter MnhD subunit